MNLDPRQAEILCGEIVWTANGSLGASCRRVSNDLTPFVPSLWHWFGCSWERLSPPCVLVFLRSLLFLPESPFSCLRTLFLLCRGTSGAGGGFFSSSDQTRVCFSLSCESNTLPIHRSASMAPRGDSGLVGKHGYKKAEQQRILLTFSISAPLLPLCSGAPLTWQEITEPNNGLGWEAP